MTAFPTNEDATSHTFVDTFGQSLSVLSATSPDDEPMFYVSADIAGCLWMDENDAMVLAGALCRGLLTTEVAARMPERVRDALRMLSGLRHGQFVDGRLDVKPGGDEAAKACIESRRASSPVDALLDAAFDA
jgi:hypothetical protein